MSIDVFDRQHLQELAGVLREATCGAFERRWILAQALDESRGEIERLLMLERVDAAEARRIDHPRRGHARRLARPVGRRSRASRRRSTGGERARGDGFDVRLVARDRDGLERGAGGGGNAVGGEGGA